MKDGLWAECPQPFLFGGVGEERKELISQRFLGIINPCVEMERLWNGEGCVRECERWDMGWRIVATLSLLLVSSVALAQDGDPNAVWKSQIGFPDEPFQSWTSPPFVKFTIITKAGFDPNLVYFQNSNQFEFHFDFALTYLEPFIGMTIEEFDNVTLHAANQQAVLGAVIVAPWHDPPFREYGIQLVRNDAYTREEIVKYFRLVQSRVLADPNVKAYYFPTYEQYPMAEQNRDWFAAQGIPVGSTAQWAEGNAIYAEGWTLGTLKFVPGTDIQRAYTARELLPDDILLTDGVPAEVPSVAGIISLMPSTPNSHVAILAASQGVPFVFLAVEQDAATAQALVGRSVYLAATRDPGMMGSTGVKLLDAGSLSETEKASLLAMKTEPPLEIHPMVSSGRFWASTDELRPTDISSFGGKASNFGILRQAIPDRSPQAMAFSFELWNAFLDQPLSGHLAGATLREEIARRLASYPTYPPADMEGLAGDLAEIRDLFKDAQATQFGQLESVVLDALRTFGFDPNSYIRFRSSTNVEDSERFTGAGLYDSFSGCLADDLDGDTKGPCTCEPDENNERGVFRAIRKVFASFYNDNAFLERLKHGVDESQVGMALLVHHSFPDEIELANGVATMEKADGRDWSVNVVCQKGAVSVTNPPTDAVPEEVRIDSGWSGPYAWVVRRSSLVPLREDTVLIWDAEYLELYDLLVTAADRYCQVTQKDDVMLDFEIKKVAPEGKLVLKQIREVPRAGNAKYDTPFLLAQPRQYQAIQGRGSNVFTNHRLKSRWTITPKSLWLNEENLTGGIYDEVTMEFVADGKVQRVAGKLPALPDAVHTYDPPEQEWEHYNLIDSWRSPNLCNPGTWRLWTIPMYQAPVPDPVVTLQDLRLDMEVDYADPVALDDVDTTTEERVSLYEPWQPGDLDIPEECSLNDPNTGVSLTTQLYVRWSWGMGAPTSMQFGQTRIEGLTTEPIVLTGFFSQTVGGGSHLCPKNFLFEPGLEPGLSRQTLDELHTKNIRLIWYTTGARECRITEWEDTPPEIRFYGFDDPLDGPPCSGR
jgi:hypothetical protein